MKTISRIFGTVAAIAALAACNKEAANIDPVIPEGMQKMTLAVSAEPDTKAVMDADGAGNLYWYGEESIAVIFDGSTTAYKFDATASEKSTSATFTGEVAQGLTKDDIIAVYYPYIDNQATSYSASVPTTQVNSGAINTTTGCYSIKFPLHWVKSGSDSDIKLTAPENSAVLFVDKKYVNPVEEGGENVVKVHVEANSDYEADYTIVMNSADEDLIFAINVPEGGAKLPAVLVNFREDLYFGEELSTKEFKTIEAGKRYKLCEPDYLTYRALDENSEISFPDNDEETAYRIFSFDEGKGEWIVADCWANINKNERVQFKVADGKERGGLGYKIFNSFSDHTWSGSIMSLINKDMDEDAFVMSFSGCGGMKIAPKLTATKLGVRCYQCMFQYCENLTVAPELPAVEATEDCYGDMFANCTSLVVAPEIHATKLEVNCYADMFLGCTSLKEAPQLPATELGDYCYMSMFMDCTALETAPALPATVLKNGCYSSMFSGCSSLVNAPELPASELVGECYRAMFAYCEQLNNVKMLATSGLDSDWCLESFLEVVAATGTITLKNESAKATLEAMDIIPEGWTVAIAQ